MMNILLWGLFFTLSAALFNFSFQLSTVARTFEGLDVSLAQSAVIAAPEAHASEVLPYFDDALFESRVQSYFKEGLGKSIRSSSYSLTYLYGGYRSHDSYGRPNEPTEAKVTFHCDLSGIYTYRNYRQFAIVKGDRYVE
jgi:hypothetical protein